MRIIVQSELNPRVWTILLGFIPPKSLAVFYYATWANWVFGFIPWPPTSHWLASHLWMQQGTQSMLWPYQSPLLPPWCRGAPSKAGDRMSHQTYCWGSISRNCKNMQIIPFGHFFHASNLVKRQHFRKMKGRGVVLSFGLVGWLVVVVVFLATTILLWYWPSRIEKW